MTIFTTPCAPWLHWNPSFTFHFESSWDPWRHPSKARGLRRHLGKWLGSRSAHPPAWVSGPTTTTPSGGPAQLTAPPCIPVCTEEADEVTIGRNLQKSELR